MISILYQNNVSGEVADISSIVSSAKWTTKKSGSPATLELTLMDDSVLFSFGSVVSVKSDGVGIFYGYIFKKGRTEKNDFKLTFYDQTRYLKNKDTYVFNNKRADEILTLIANDYKLKLGVLANTGYVIPSMIEDSQTLFDIVLKGLDYTLVNSKKMFYLWDDFGSLRISDAAQNTLDIILGDDSLVTSFSYSSDIDSDTFNIVKLVRDNKESGKRDVWEFRDSYNIGLWGILQNYEKVEENMNEGQIKEMGAKMLELYNRPKKSFEVSAFSDLSVRAGRALSVRINDINVSSFFIVDEASHDLIKETMKLKLKVV